MKFYTGLPSDACLLASSICNRCASKIQTARRFRYVFTDTDENKTQPTTKGSGIPIWDLRFIGDNLHPLSHPSSSQKLTFLIHNPEQEEIMSCRPQCFKETFPKCVSIIDCTEVFIAAPADFEARNATYSSYKHTHTVTFLVSFNPAGAVSFISPAYPGTISVLTHECSYLNFIPHGDVILAELVIPAFTTGKSQLSARDGERGRKISNVRILVERAMERLKNFRILADRLHSKRCHTQTV